jgi:hypothetical protein
MKAITPDHEFLVLNTGVHFRHRAGRAPPGGSARPTEHLPRFDRTGYAPVRPFDMGQASGLRRRKTNAMRLPRPAECCLAGVAALAALSLAADGRALAQRALSAREMQECLCLARSLQTLHREVELRRTIYEERQAALAELAQARRQRYGTIDTNDPVQIEAYKRLLTEERGLERRIARDILPDYHDSIARYNQAVGRYNAQCGTASYTAPVLQEAQHGLVCPGE